MEERLAEGGAHQEGCFGLGLLAGFWLVRTLGWWLIGGAARHFAFLTDGVKGSWLDECSLQGYRARDGLRIDVLRGLARAPGALSKRLDADAVVCRLDVAVLSSCSTPMSWPQSWTLQLC